MRRERPVLRQLAEVSVSERVVVAVILLNTAAIFLRAFDFAGPTLDLQLYVIDYLCTVFFIVEGFLKVRLWGLREYLSTPWNRFDATIIALSTPMLLSPLLMGVEDFSVLLLLRVARLARFFRLLRFVPDRRRLWQGIKRGLKASVGVALALGLFNVVLALAAHSLFGDRVPQHFGDPLRAMFSMFQVFTLEGWHEIANDTAHALSPGYGAFARLFFVLVVVSGGILGLSMVNAVFVDEMVLDNANELELLVEQLRGDLERVRDHHTQEVARLEARLVELLTASGAVAPTDRGPAADPEPGSDDGSA